MLLPVPSDEEIILLTIIDDISWFDISLQCKMTQEFIEKYEDKLIWFLLLQHNQLSEELIRKYINKYHEEIYRFQNLSIDFIEEFISQMSARDWYNLSYNDIKLPKIFIEKYKDKLYWQGLCHSQILSEEFMEKHVDLLYWNNVALYQDYSDDFFNKYKDKIINTHNFQIKDNYGTYLAKNRKQNKEFLY